MTELEQKDKEIKKLKKLLMHRLRMIWKGEKEEIGWM